MSQSNIVRALALGSFVFAATLASGQEEEPARRVYLNEFADTVGDEWSRQTSSVTPLGERRFLGEFGPETVTLTLEEMPAHRLVRLSFDLFLIKSWDGSSKNWGPDIWELSVAGGQRLIYATFTNCGFFSDNNQQSFPDNYPLGPHRGWTGATEKQTLGYKFFKDRNRGQGYVTDGVYKLTVTFPHTGRDLRLNFTSHCADPVTDQSWGLDNVQVEVLSRVRRLTDTELNACWNSLGDNDAAAAFPAVWKLAATDGQAVAFLERKLIGKRVAQDEKIKSLIHQLDSEGFAQREAATRQLAEYGAGIGPLLQTAIAQSDSAEVRARLKYILSQFAAQNTSQVDFLLRQRGTRVLEVINSAAARELLTILRASETKVEEKGEEESETGREDEGAGEGE